MAVPTFRLRNDDPAVVIEGCLYIGSASAAGNGRHLEELQIAGVINCAHEVPNFAQAKFEYLRLEWREVAGEYLADVEDRCLQFIDRHRGQGRAVLVHCLAGVSRSASVCLMYLMRRERMDLQAAFSKVFTNRSTIFPNRHLWNQLQEIGKVSLSIEDCMAKAMIPVQGQGSTTRELNSSATLKQRYLDAENMTGGTLHLDINNANFDIDPELFDLVKNPPKRVTLIKIGKGCSMSDSLRSLLRCKLHIVFD